MKRKNVSYKIVEISVRILCHQCKERLESPSGDVYWDKNDIGKQMHFEIICPKCQTVNKLPERLINTAAGF